MLKQMVVAVTVVGMLMFSPDWSGASTAAKGATKLRVHVSAGGKRSVGYAKLKIRRAGSKKPVIHHRTGAHGNFTTAKIPAGKYVVRATHRGMHGATGSMEVTGAGTHKMTITMGRELTRVTAVHTRVVHALGVKKEIATVKKVVKPAEKSKETKTENKTKSTASKAGPKKDL